MTVPSSPHRIPQHLDTASPCVFIFTVQCSTFQQCIQKCPEGSLWAYRDFHFILNLLGFPYYNVCSKKARFLCCYKTGPQRMSSQQNRLQVHVEGKEGVGKEGRGLGRRTHPCPVSPASTDSHYMWAILTDSHVLVRLAFYFRVLSTRSFVSLDFCSSLAFFFASEVQLHKYWSSRLTNYLSNSMPKIPLAGFPRLPWFSQGEAYTLT